MLTSFVDNALITDAIRAGAIGYVLKGVSTDELVRALDAARNGTALLDPAITRQVLTMLRHQGSHRNPFAELTKRELIVLSLVAKSKTNREIAADLTLSEKTIRNNVSIILSKLEASNRIEAAMFAMKHHIEDFLPDN